MSREQARKYSFKTGIDPCVIVSIDTDGDHVKLNRNASIKDVLCLTFDDVETGDTAITEHHAEQIANFVRRWINKVDTVIVHCDAGVSRSAGIGAAIMKWANGDDSAIFNNGRFIPNMRCFRMMLNAFNVNTSDR